MKQRTTHGLIHWREFLKLTGLTARQIQWADETGTLTPTIVNGQGGHAGKTRYYHKDQVQPGRRLALISRHSPHSVAERKKLICLQFSKVVRVKEPIVIEGTLYTR